MYLVTKSGQFLKEEVVGRKEILKAIGAWDLANEQDFKDEESDGDTYSSSPLAIPPPPSFASLAISTMGTRDADGDKTMVNQSQDPLPSQVGATDDELDPREPGTPTMRRCEDPPWIIRHIQKSVVEPSLTQPSTRGAPPTSSPPSCLPKGLVHTPKPAGGFPVIHLSTPSWFNLLPEQRDRFDSYLVPKVWIRDWQASKEADLMALSDKLKDLIKRMTGERVRLSTPQQEKEISSRKRNEKQKPPYHFLVSDISVRSHGILLAHPIMSTPEASAFFLPYTPPLPSFLCTIEGFTLSIRDAEAIIESEEVATGIVRRTLTEDETVITVRSC
ncbi:hypothetical protein C0992_007921 [Termitomyces sp. T32_za158]|nr:hypothetical protein C0992_007921 [Termitomyces sp. T32_za158]